MAEQPGDRGRNWFAIDVTSDFVEPGAFPFPEYIIEVTTGPVPDSSQMVHAGPIWSEIGEFAATFELLPARVPEITLVDSSFELVQLRQQEVEVALYLSDIRATIRRDDEALLLGLF